MSDAVSVRTRLLELADAGDHEQLRTEITRLFEDGSGARFWMHASRAVDRIATRDDLPLPRVRLRLLRSFTAESMVPAMRASAFAAGVLLSVDVGAYGLFEQEIAGAPEPSPDAWFLFGLLDDLAPALTRRFVGTAESDRAHIASELIERASGWLSTVRASHNAPIWLSAVAPPRRAPLGLADRVDSHGQHDTVETINRGLAKACRDTPDCHLFDFDRVERVVGLERMYDDRMMWQASQPLSSVGIAAVARELARSLAARFTRRRKCVVVDCDNTLWGGVVGEDGADGIALGPEFPGRCYVRFQQALLDLHKRGVILAIASKNNDADVFEIFDAHPHRVLTREHFAATRIDWNDKASNLRALAEEINIGLDAMIFIDDSDFEISLVRGALPQVECVQAPTDPVELATLADELWSLDALRISDTDRDRGQMYRAQAERNRAESAATSLPAFLASLELAVEVQPLTESHLARAAQLTQRTNQFNMTTVRRSEAEVARFCTDDDAAGVVVRVRDRFGDYGVCGLALIERDGEAAVIDTLLLSCRVIGRSVEAVVLAAIDDMAKSWSCTAIRGAFVPTRKNAPASAVYASHGFSRDRGADDGDNQWFEKPVSNATSVPDWIEVVQQKAS